MGSVFGNVAVAPCPCYLLARAIGARRVVEFGTSCCISTIYLACAVRDNGGGQVVGTEMVPAKAARTRANLVAAGLGDLVEIRVGDARETLRGVVGPVDLLLNDGIPGLPARSRQRLRLEPARDGRALRAVGEALRAAAVASPGGVGSALRRGRSREPPMRGPPAPIVAASALGVGWAALDFTRDTLTEHGIARCAPALSFLREACTFGALG